MKTIIKVISLLSLAVTIFVSCSKSKSDPGPAPATFVDPTVSLGSGKWIISLYSQKTEIKTDDFSGVSFVFTNGSFTATKAGVSTNGSWTYSPSSVGYYGSGATLASITFNAGISKPYSSLNRTWNIDSSTSTYLSLVNPEPRENEHIHFTKE